MSARTVNKIWTGIFYIVAIFVIILLSYLVFEILKKGWGFWDPSFLTGRSSNMDAGGGIGYQLFNSFYMLIITLIISVPLGLGAGIYLAEYAKPGKLLTFIRLCIDTMASLPSIVVGLFGLLVFVTATGWGYTIIGGALAITILNLPSLTRVSEAAITEVSAGVKEASLGLGATKWQTIVKIALPTAMPQIITGVILAAGRIFGEAAALIFTAGLTTPILNTAADLTSPVNPFNIFRPAETLAVHIWKLNSEGIVPDATAIATKSAAVLIIMVLIFNLLARLFSKIIQKHFEGGKSKTKQKASVS
ncbi:phosphate ABC transporter permease PstA [Pradoshia sp. D12]|uniref:phosphate ABC transporter permease PstA n=1 Tax=Bacillaceae TaxID=186817 RepID=UPI00080AD50F|nr:MULTISPECIES: phosphate ABC transporter permease PstA [Bacillaceae]OCA86402.1 phosphate ABC transporter, permease protein PstA [Bacillus sp. FJAT-27986]QFK72201.1 phosphate ABC transporter permease PstA [Pradoshia sp. D12]TPF71306.1 phosphate ABC transporter permease PstA [Bacillus sp. D12]